MRLVWFVVCLLFSNSFVRKRESSWDWLRLLNTLNCFLLWMPKAHWLICTWNSWDCVLIACLKVNSLMVGLRGRDLSSVGVWSWFVHVVMILDLKSSVRGDTHVASLAGRLKVNLRRTHIAPLSRDQREAFARSCFHLSRRQSVASLEIWCDRSLRLAVVKFYFFLGVNIIRGIEIVAPCVRVEVIEQ